MIKQKSKSNILTHNKKDINTNNCIIKSKDKLPSGSNKTQKSQKHSKSSNNTVAKSKNTNEKNSQTKTSFKTDHQLIFPVQRRNTPSIVSQRAPSRLSNKRSSVVSCNSNKFLKDQQHKENDQNKNNFNQIQIEQNQCPVEDLKKSFKDAKSKKKLSLNINTKQQEENFHGKETQKKSEKCGKIQMFEKKMSKYLNEKDLFSEQFLQETNLNKQKSKKTLNVKTKQKMEENMQKCKEPIDTDNMFLAYQFYKKTFDINLKTCMKKGSIGSKDYISRQTTSKTTIKPSQSSTLILSKQANLKFLDSKMDLCERKNGSNCSNASKSRSKSKQALSKSRKNESRSIYDKENRLWSQIQMSSLIESRSKSRSSMVNSSQTLAKDHLLSYQVDKECANSKIQQANLKRSKQSYKNLIVFKQNQSKCNHQQTIQKESDMKKHQTDDFKQESRKQCGKEAFRFQVYSDKYEVIDMKKVEIGQSKIDVLKWWSNSKRQLSTSIMKNQGQNDDKIVQAQGPTQIQVKREHDTQKGLMNDMPIDNALEDKEMENLIPIKSLDLNSQKNNQQELSAQKLRKKQSEQISSLGDLSSISSIQDITGSNSNMKQPTPILFQMQDAVFEL